MRQLGFKTSTTKPLSKRERTALYKKAVRKWGINLQFAMLIEECAELIQSVNKLMRRDYETGWNRLAEEMADVEIMIEQLRLFIDWQTLDYKVKAYKELKLDRLKYMIKGGQ